MDVNTFINVFNGNGISQNLPQTVKLSDLLPGYEYELCELKRIYTRYGTSLLAILFDERTNCTFQVYLPHTYVNRFTEDNLQIVKRHKMKFTCNGVEADGKTFILSITL